MSDARLGVIGGTFDPIHYGHLRLADEALYQFKLDRVLFIPARLPPHKSNEPVTDPRDRWAMTLLATADHPNFEVSSMEMERQGPSYTVDTLAELHRVYGDRTRLFFILGADAVLEMSTWKQPERVLELCDLILSARPGFDLQALARVPVPGLVEKAQMLHCPLTDLSSTHLRGRIRAGQSITYLTPDPVINYIRKARLYTAVSG